MQHNFIAQQILQDNPLLYNKIEKATQLPRESVLPVLIEVLRFMQLAVVANERLTPSHIVDMAWHEFILFTRYYADFCEKELGRFIHHHPGGNEEENRQNFKKTHYWYQKTFGEAPPSVYWGQVLVEISDESDCGLCTNA